jgi:hypothetical protein
MKEAIIIVLLGLLLMAYAANNCNLGQLYTLSMTTHNPSVRKDVTLSWMKSNAKNCNNQQLIQIYNNLPHWLGTADNSEIRSVIYENYKRDK